MRRMYCRKLTLPLPGTSNHERLRYCAHCFVAFHQTLITRRPHARSIKSSINAETAPPRYISQLTVPILSRYNCKTTVTLTRMSAIVQSLHRSEQLRSEKIPQICFQLVQLIGLLDSAQDMLIWSDQKPKRILFKTSST